jgi:hypothetical protein
MFGSGGVSAWENIRTAPRNETPVRVRTADGFELVARFIQGFISEDEEDCGGWVAEEDGVHPDDWCDGVCWSSNSDGNPSDPPVAWLNPDHINPPEAS